MKTKRLFFILLALCMVFFLAGCDSGGGSSSSSGGDDGDDDGFEIGHTFDAESVTVDGTPDTSLTFTAEITTNKGGTFKIKNGGIVVSEGTWEVTEWANKSEGRPKIIKYQEKKAWNGATLAEVTAGSHTTDVSGGTLTIESVADSGHTAVFGLEND